LHGFLDSSLLPRSPLPSLPSPASYSLLRASSMSLYTQPPVLRFYDHRGEQQMQPHADSIRQRYFCILPRVKRSSTRVSATKTSQQGILLTHQPVHGPKWDLRPRHVKNLPCSPEWGRLTSRLNLCTISFYFALILSKAGKDRCIRLLHWSLHKRTLMAYSENPQGILGVCR
jgi:hypothetical protein